VAVLDSKPTKSIQGTDPDRLLFDKSINIVPVAVAASHVVGMLPVKLFEAKLTVAKTGLAPENKLTGRGPEIFEFTISIFVTAAAVSSPNLEPNVRLFFVLF